MRVAIVGCGYVADFYMDSWAKYADLELMGVADKDAARLKQFADHYRIAHRYASFEELLSDTRVEMVLNLTDPRSHYELSMACLRAGKHVYSEKPLAMQFAQAKELVEEAEKRGLHIVSAPCSLLTGAPQSMWSALRAGVIGTPRLAYATMDDGMVFKERCDLWRSKSGAPWPCKDEFEIGVTLEHAGYVVTWLAAFFGPVKTVTCAASTLFPDKIPGEKLNMLSPDVSLTTLTFVSGAMAHITCSLIASPSRTLHIYGTGSEHPLICDDMWHYDRIHTLRSLTHSPSIGAKLWRRFYRHVLRKVWPGIHKVTIRPSHRIDRHMDFARGPADLAAAVREGRQPRMTPRFGLHVNEITLAISNASANGSVYTMTTTFEPIEPMPSERAYA